MDFSASMIAEVMGVALVFVGLFKLDAINKGLGSLSEFAKHTTEEVKNLRERTHDHASEIFSLRARLDVKDRYDNQQRQSDKDR